MPGFLEIIALTKTDVLRAAEGGADRIELVGTMRDEGLAPEPEVVADICAESPIPVRCMLRLRAGFGTDGGEATRLRGLLCSYLAAGADGVVMGYLNGYSQVDTEVMLSLLNDGPAGGSDFGWTFHRAIDATFDRERAWRTIRRLPQVDQVLTAGSARGVSDGLNTLIAEAKSDPEIANLILAGGGLQTEHIPWLVRAGISSFHLGTSARVEGSYDEPVSASKVHSWRALIDSSVDHIMEV